MSDVVYLSPHDNICVAARNLDLGEKIIAGPHAVTVSEDIRLGHKIAVAPIDVGEPVRKYGQTIGFATQCIEPGRWVHSHNLAAGQFDRKYEFGTEAPPPPPPISDRAFNGYRRGDGRAGTRNYLAVISTVNCSASVAKHVAGQFDKSLLRDYPNIDGILPITHQGGCGMQYAGEAHAMLNRVLGGFAKHPNVGGYLLVGLGCETGAMGFLLEQEGLVQLGGPAPKRPPVFSMQDLGGTTATVEAATRHIAEMLPAANDVRREPIPAAELILATECGGSDGNSGVTANPALGVAADMLVATGGTVILAETPEIYGAEHLLTRRAKSREVGEKLIERIRWWEKYTAMFDVELDNNPSPGNKEGGLTTIYEKSLGAVAKAGTTALADVYQYAETVRTKGFVVMDSPGYDPVSVTGMVAGGANLIAFTTGRGSCYGCQPVPSLKICTNTPTYQRMLADMDVDAGVVLSGTPLKEVGQHIFEMLLEVASGRQTKSEQHGIGEEEFCPWQVGPTL